MIWFHGTSFMLLSFCTIIGFLGLSDGNSVNNPAYVFLYWLLGLLFVSFVLVVLVLNRRNNVIKSQVYAVSTPANALPHQP